MEPTLGRIVLYRSEIEQGGQTAFAAIVTAVDAEKKTVGLRVFPPRGGMEDRNGVSQGDADTPKSWFWPPGPAATVAAQEGTTTTATEAGKAA
jgi:hypothetical protein